MRFSKLLPESNAFEKYTSGCCTDDKVTIVLIRAACTSRVWIVHSSHSTASWRRSYRSTVHVHVARTLWTEKRVRMAQCNNTVPYRRRPPKTFAFQTSPGKVTRTHSNRYYTSRIHTPDSSARASLERGDFVVLGEMFFFFFYIYYEYTQVEPTNGHIRTQSFLGGINRWWQQPSW